MKALPIREQILSPIVPQRFRRSVRFGILSTCSSPPCGLARFTAGLAGALCGEGTDAGVIRVGEAQLDVAGWMDSLNEFDVAIIQYGHGVCGFAAEELAQVVDGLRVPSIVVAHTIPKERTVQGHSALETIAAMADQVVVMSEAARQRLRLAYSVDRRKVTTIPHGATIPSTPRMKSPSRPTILTWGLMHPEKGLARVIDAMPSLGDVPGRPRYVVAGPTHPEVLAADGEAYRDARIEQARRNGVADSVSFDSSYYDGAMLTALVQQSSVVVLPYDSTDQVTSGVLVDAIATGRPVVATAFPHAVELLGGGAGIVVDHDDPVALASALRQVITQPRLAGSMAAEARSRAPEMAWPVVASQYVALAQRLLAERR